MTTSNSHTVAERVKSTYFEEWSETDHKTPRFFILNWQMLPALAIHTDTLDAVGGPLRKKGECVLLWKDGGSLTRRCRRCTKNTRWNYSIDDYIDQALSMSCTALGLPWSIRIAVATNSLTRFGQTRLPAPSHTVSCRCS